MNIYIDGEFFEEQNAKISVLDHGLLYGDGIFEGIRAYSGRVFRLDDHLNRLFDSAKAILLNIPMSRDELKEAILETCRRNDVSEGYIRLVVTRGKGTLGLSPFKCPKASVIVIAASLELYPEEYYQNGLKVVTASTWRNSPAALNPSVKSLNYLNNVLAKIEGVNAGVQEVLMLNQQGYVAECSGDNVFVLKHGKLYTPPVYSGGLGGITRRTVMELAGELGIECVEVELTRYDLYVAEEMFLTGTGAKVVPVVDLDARSIGDGSVGEWTRKFMKAYEARVRSTGVAIFE